MTTTSRHASKAAIGWSAFSSAHPTGSMKRGNSFGPENPPDSGYTISDRLNRFTTRRPGNRV